MLKNVCESDLSDVEWGFLKPLISLPNPVAALLRGADARFSTASSTSYEVAARGA
jgi:hypothetical protein